MLLNIIVVVVVLLLFLVAFMLVRTLAFARPLEPVEEFQPAEVDAAAIAGHLSAALRFQTVSVMDGNPAGYLPFLDLQRYLELTYPLVHTHLQRKRIQDYALVYTWVGSNPELDAVVLMSHQDVVPAPPETLADWEHPPFDGTIADGYVWGRGALDMKHQLVALLEAVEHHLADGFQPERTVILAFGFDEEIGGNRGGKEIAAWLKEQGIGLEAVLDEGPSVTDQSFPELDVPIGLIGVAEKGVLNLRLEVASPPGHSAVPPKETAIGILSKAIAFLEATPQYGNFASARMLLRGLGAVLPFSQQFALANEWLFGGAVRRRLNRTPPTYALTHTTCAPTIIQAGSKENVLPARATANINFRLLPGDSIAAVCERVRKIMDDERVKFEPVQGFLTEASTFSNTDTPAFEILARTIRQMFGGIPVAPALVLGASDARYLHEICESVYRFTPLVMANGDRNRIHGINERIGVEALGKMVQFFIQLISAWAGPVENT